jgi:hypothetical protein
MLALKTVAHSLSRTIILLCGVLCLSMQTIINREYQVKAVFLFNFTQFVEWPANAFNGPETPIVIGVLGKNPFGTYLDETVLNEKVNNRSLLVHYYSSPEEVKNCQIVFINLDTKKLEQALLALKGKNILTVSDQNSFLNQGGMIRFFTKNNKIQLQINPEAAKAAELSVSSKLLRLAEIVVPEKK